MFRLLIVSGAALFWLMLPVGLRAESFKGIEYSHPGNRRLLMDVHLPGGDGPFPAAIVVHGGAWVAGSRNANVHTLFKPLSTAGFAWFSISYRLARKSSLKGPIIDASKMGNGIEDVAQAVAYVRRNAARFHIDPERIVIVGESSGAHLAAMAAVRGAPVKAVVAFYGPMDLWALAKPSGAFSRTVARVTWGGNSRSQLRDLSPINFVRAGMPPFLFVHGTADGIVPFDQSTRMCDAMRGVHARCEVIAVPGALHGLQLWDVFHKNAYKREMIDWMLAVTGSR